MSLFPKRYQCQYSILRSFLKQISLNATLEGLFAQIFYLREKVNTRKAMICVLLYETRCKTLLSPSCNELFTTLGVKTRCPQLDMAASINRYMSVCFLCKSWSSLKFVRLSSTLSSLFRRKK